MNSTAGSSRYRLSFTAGTLYLREAPIAVDLYLSSQNWVEVSEELRSRNMLQARTLSTAKRWSHELVQRLSGLSDPELRLLADSTGDELAQLMWVATCRQYLLIGEFAEEVVRERFLLTQLDLVPGDFDIFVNQKVLWHEELGNLAASTYQKLRSTLFKMLLEAALLSEAGKIIEASLSPRLRTQLSMRQPSDVRFFPSRGTA